MFILPSIPIEAHGTPSAETLSALTKIAYAGIVYFLAFVLDATIFFAPFNVMSYIFGVVFILSLILFTCDVSFMQGIYSQLVRTCSCLEGSSNRMQCLMPILFMSGFQTIVDLVTIGIPLLQSGLYSPGGLAMSGMAFFLGLKVVIMLCYLVIAWYAYDIFSRVRQPARGATGVQNGGQPANNGDYTQPLAADFVPFQGSGNRLNA